MNTALSCPSRGDGELLHRYVAGTLAPAELEAFETHLLACAGCQAAVREGGVLRAALSRPAPRRRAWLRPAVLALPAAAAIAGIWLAGRPSAVARLGRLDLPPGFAGAPVRTGTDSATALADEGMRAYGACRYREAARLLAAAGAANRSARTPALVFYLGAATLLAGEPRDAAPLLAEAADPRGPYAADATILLAKAWLQLERPDSALAVLDRIAAPGRGWDRVRAFADSVRSLPR